MAGEKVNEVEPEVFRSEAFDIWQGVYIIIPFPQH